MLVKLFSLIPCGFSKKYVEDEEISVEVTVLSFSDSLQCLVANGELGDKIPNADVAFHTQTFQEIGYAMA